MSDQRQHGNGGPGANDGFEHQDMGPKAAYGFLISLAVLGILVYFVVNATYHGLNRYFQAHQPAQSPLNQTAEGDTRDLQKSKVDEKIKNTFPQPLLETDERNELNDFRTEEAKQLNSYGWVDQKAGVVHIPIERAMQLVAERGLPLRSDETNSGSPAKMSPPGKLNAAKKTAKQ